jgi:hypothetical protein
MSKNKRSRTYKPAPIDPDALWITRQQSARLCSVNVQLIDKWLENSEQIKRYHVPGRGTDPSRRHVLICRADLEKYVEQFLKSPTLREEQQNERPIHQVPQLRQPGSRRTL